MKDTFIPGDWNVICDVSGFKMKASECVKQWDGAWVRKDLARPRHPQDSIRGHPERIRTPWSRPEQTDTFGQTDAEDL